MSEPVACNLIGNALDYLLLAGEHANAGSTRMLKHALATLADGMELLLKARLEVHAWFLLFRQIDEADRTKFESGDFQSVTFEQAIKRLEQICNVDIDKNSLILLNTLRGQRNKIRHFAIATDKAAVESLIAKAYAFGIDFTTTQLEEHLDEDATTTLQSLRGSLGQYEAFVSARLEQIQETLAKQDYAVHITCPFCQQETLYPESGESSCAFCGYRASGEDAAAAWFERHYGHIGDPKERMMRDDQIMSCPECGSWACINDDFHGRVCLACGDSGKYSRCSRCDQLISGESLPGDHCSDCWDRMLENND